jgi:hypothetical protein
VVKKPVLMLVLVLPVPAARGPAAKPTAATSIFRSIPVETPGNGIKFT